MDNKIVNIKVIEHYYRCGDGCCEDWWYQILVNEKLLMVESGDPRYPMAQRFTSVEVSPIKAILENLGYKVNIDVKYLSDT